MVSELFDAIVAEIDDDCVIIIGRGQTARSLQFRFVAVDDELELAARVIKHLHE